MFGPILLNQLELHRARWTPLEKGTKLRSKLGLQYEIWRVMGEEVLLKRIGVKKSKYGRRQIWCRVTQKLVRERLVIENYD